MDEPIPAPELSTEADAFAAFDKLLEPSISTPEADVDPGLVAEPAVEEAAPVVVAEDRNPDGTFKAKKARNDPQARIDEITAKHREAERERDAARAELAALRRPVEQPIAKPAVAEAEPDATDTTTYPGGEYDPKYLRDIGRFEARKEFNRLQGARDADTARERQVSSVEAKLGDYSKRVLAGFKTPKERDAFLETLSPELHALRPSYVEAILNKDFNPSAPIPAANVIADQIVEFEHPDRALAYLNDHPDDFQRLLTLHPIAIVREMGKLEERLSAAPSRPATEPPKSNARPPIQRVESAPLVADRPPAEDADVEAHFAYYNRVQPVHR